MPNEVFPKVMIHVQHLLGTGHLKRSAHLAAELSNRGFLVHLVSGGRPVPGLVTGGARFHQLAPLRASDATFSRLLDEDDKLITKDWIRARGHGLLALANEINPDVLITETFPFGRRMLRFELLPLLTAVRERNRRPLVISSIRDILQPKSKPGRDLEVLEWINEYYDHVLIHGDARVSTLDDTFPFAHSIVDKCCYTGYIVDSGSEDVSTAVGSGEVIVSGGGGAACVPLMQTAIEARHHSMLRDRKWRLLVGHNLDDSAFQQLCTAAPDGVVVERNRDDFPALLRNCAVSVSQAGYNTVMDILRSNVRALLVPFSDSGELEQQLRAELLEKCGRLAVLPQSELTPLALANAVDRASQRQVEPVSFHMAGAEQSAQCIKEWLRER